MLKTKLLTWLIRPASYFSVRYQHQLRLFIQCKIVVLRKLSTGFIVQVILEALLLTNSNIVVLRKLSTGFIVQVILEALLLTNSNIQEHFMTLSQAVCTQLVLWENIL